MAIEQKFMFQLGLLFISVLFFYFGQIRQQLTVNEEKLCEVFYIDFPHVAIKYHILYKERCNNIYIYVYKCEESCDPNISSFIL